MSRPLNMFMRGKRVTMLQELLGRMGYPTQDQPGLFGASTRDGVKNFQKQRQLKPTGLVDDELLKLMQQGHVTASSKKKRKPKKAPSPIPVNQQQLDALIRLLIRKDLINEDELQVEMERPQPVRVTQPPLT